MNKKEIFLATAFVILIVLLSIYLTSKIEIPIKTEAELQSTENENNSVYIICDVIETYTDNNGTHVVCEMPDKDLLDCIVIDAPLGEIELVCFITDNQDDYTSYKIVALR